MVGSTTYQYILNLNDRMTGALQRAGIAGSQTYDRLQARQNRLNASVNSFNGLMGRLGVSLGVFGLYQFGKKIITAGVEIEQTRISFETFLQSAQKGNAMIEALQSYADTTTFTFDGLQKATKLLLGYGIEEKKIMPTLKMLGDISGGNAEKMYSLSLAYAQMSSAGKLMGQDLLQMINAGFNPLKQISDSTGVSVGELRKQMEAGKISAEMVETAFKTATSQGGRFYQMLDKQGKTLGGRWSTFMDNIGRVFRKWGEAVSGSAKDIVEKLIKAVEWFVANQEQITSIVMAILRPIGWVLKAVWGVVKAFIDMFRWLNEHRTVMTILVTVIGSMVAAYYALRVAAIANAAIMKITTLLALEQALAGRTLTIWQGLAAIATKGFTGAMRALNLTFLASPIFWITAAIIGLIAAIAYVVYKTDGWGKMWKHTVAGAKLLWQGYTDFVKAYFTTMIDGLIIAINKIMVAFYKAKQAVGMGDKRKNQEQIDKFNADTEQRKNNIKGAWTKVGDTAKAAAEQFKLAGQSLTWNKDRSIGDMVKGIKKTIGLDEKAPEGSNLDGTFTPDGGDPFAGIGDTGKGITGGGSRPTTINITLDNLVREINISTATLKEGVNDIEEQVREAMLRVLNSANGVAYGN